MSCIACLAKHRHLVLRKLRVGRAWICNLCMQLVNSISTSNHFLSLGSFPWPRMANQCSRFQPVEGTPYRKFPQRGAQCGRGVDRGAVRSSNPRPRRLSRSARGGRAGVTQADGQLGRPSRLSSRRLPDVLKLSQRGRDRRAGHAVLAGMQPAPSDAWHIDS